MDAANSLAIFVEENRQKYFRYLFLLQFVAAIPFLWFSYETGKVHARLSLHGSRTRGTIVAVVPVRYSSSSGMSSTAYEPVVTFTAGPGSHADEFRFQEWKATKVAPAIGTNVSVLYDPEDPDIAMLDRGYLNYLPWAPCAAIGAFLVLVAVKGFVTQLFSRLRTQNQPQQ
jgi:hypothetical protein